MRVLILDRTTVNPYSRGLAQGLREVGCRVVLAGAPGFTDEGVIAAYPRYGVRGMRLKKTIEAAPSVLRLLRVMHQFRPDIVHFQWASALEATYLRIGRLAGAKVVYTVHNPGARTKSRAHAYMLRHADALLVHGPKLVEELGHVAPSSRERTHPIEHGNYEHAIERIPRDHARAALGLAYNDSIFVYFGQLSPRKGLEILIDAYRASSTESRSRRRLLIVGTDTDPSYSRSLRARAAGTDILWQTDVNALPQRSLDEAISAADVVVLPFTEATQSGSVLYAMTHGRCVITTAVGEIPRTLADAGILLPPGDSGALEAALIECERRGDFSISMGERARARALMHFSWTTIATATLDVYRQVVQGKGT